MKFPGRRLLRGVAIVVGLLILGLQGALVSILLIPGLFVLKKLNDSYGVLEVDDHGFRLRRPVSQLVSVPWEQVASVRYWEVIQIVHGGRCREYFLEVTGVNGRRLLSLKSTFEREAYEYLLERARIRRIRVDLI